MFNSWEELKNACAACEKCALCETRHNVVVGVGTPDAEVMFIGEGPGENEDLQGEPFVGRAGKLLDKMLTAVDLDRNKNIYIANIVKCRPPQNRDPKPEEQEMCIDWLRNAAARIIKPDIKITREHGQFIEKNGVLMMAMLHPAAILRDPRKKPEAFNDFLILRDKINEICDHTYNGQ